MSKIEWTGKTWNPVVGCSLVSPGCTNCYAMKQAARCAAMGLAKYDGLTKDSKAGPVWTGVVRLDESSLDWPLRRRKPLRIFVNSMSDLFHENLPDEAIDKVFAVMALCPQHTFQVLTKRAERMRDYMTRWKATERLTFLARAHEPGTMPMTQHEIEARLLPSALVEHRRLYRVSECVDWPLRNVWLGVSVEDQARADERIPLLLDTPAAVRFLSCEPLLGPVDLTPWLHRDATPPLSAPHSFRPIPPLDWVIVGGESGPGARPMDPNWARSIRDQCAAAGVSFFMKQMTKKGPIPDDLFIREFPDAA
jgi:protein gp37